ncbi:MAG: IPT/TIG domain-containing protein [Pseudomonadota bacterium]
MKLKTQAQASVVLVLVFLLAGIGLAQGDGKVTMEQWLKIINSKAAKNAPPAQATDAKNSDDVQGPNSNTLPDRPGISVTVYWHMADDADVYLNGKPLRSYDPSFKTRSDEAPQPAFSATAIIGDGDIFTVGGRRGGSYGFMLIAVDSSDNVVFMTDQQSWKVYEPGDRADWYTPQAAESSQSREVTVQPDPWFPQKALNSKYGNKALAIWSEPAKPVAYLYGIFRTDPKTPRHPGVQNKNDGGSSQRPGIAVNKMNEKTEVAVDTVLETRTVTIDQAGGIVTLQDGASLTAAAGALQASADVTLSRIGNAVYFGNPGNLTYEVSKNAIDAGMTFSVPLGKDLPAKRIAVMQYTMDMPAAADGIPYIAPEFSYDAAAGLAAITLGGSQSAAGNSTPGPTAVPASDETIRITVETPVAATVKSAVAPIRIPYYQQVGPSCWAADAIMITGAHGRRPGIPTVLKAMNRTDAPDAGWGLSTRELNKIFPAAMKIATGLNFKTSLYVNKDNLLQELLRLLTNERPVLMGLPASAIDRTGAHAVVFLGYEPSSNPADAGYLFTVMDPKGVFPADSRDGGMYSVRSWQWFLDWFRPHIIDLPPSIAIAWVDMPTPAPDSAVASLGIPSGGFPVGAVAFGVPKPEVEPLQIFLVYKPSAPEGTAWGDGMRKFYDVIPNSAETLDINLPVWNSGTAPFSGVVTVDFQQSGKKAGGQRFPVTCPPGPKPVYVAGTIAVKDFRGSDDVQDMTPPPLPFTVLVTLEDSSGKRVDRFSAEFTLQPGPRITEVTPASAEPGEPINIVGRNFGKYQFNSRVMISGYSAEVTNWSDTTIEAVVPASPEPGDVIVHIADLQSNAFPLKRKAKIGSDAPTAQGNGMWVLYDISRGSENKGADFSSVKFGDDGLAGTFKLEQADPQTIPVEINWRLPPAQLVPGSSIALTAKVTHGSLQWPGNPLEEKINSSWINGKLVWDEKIHSADGTATLVVPDLNAAGTMGDLYAITYNASGQAGPGMKAWNGITFKYRYIKAGDAPPETPSYRLMKE